MLTRIKSLKRDLASKRVDAHFLFVYIMEAHGTDEWPVPSSRCNRGKGAVRLKQTMTLKSRRDAAASMISTFPDIFKNDLSDVPRSSTFCMMIDEPERNDPFECLFAPWPLRFFILGDGGRVDFIMDPQKCSYNLEELRNFLMSSTRR